MTYAPGDPSLPLLLHDSSFDGQIYYPASNFVTYVNLLYEGGYSPETIRPDFADLYLLDYYDGQVRNGGHSQFVGNSGPRLHDNIDRARRAARVIGLEGRATCLEDLQAWCRANPEEAALQDGHTNKAGALKALDRHSGWDDFTDAELQDYLGTIPAPLADRLRGKLAAPADAEQRIAAFLTEFDSFSTIDDLETLWIKAFPHIAPLVERRAELESGGRKNEYYPRSLERNKKDLFSSIELIFNKRPIADCRSNLETTARRLINPQLYDRSAYHIRAWVHLAAHPDLQQLPDETLKEACAAILAQSPFVAAELESRQLHKMHRRLPSSDQLSLSVALGRLQSGGPADLPKSFPWSDPGNSAARQRHILETSSGRHLVLIRQDGRVRLHNADVPAQPGLLSRLLSGKPAAADIAFVDRQSGQARRYKIGQELASVPADETALRLMRDLFLPEAMLKTPDFEALYPGFARGVFDRFDPAGQAFVWRFFGSDAEVVYTADAKGIKLDGAGPTTYFPSSELRDLRNARLRHPVA